MEKLNYLASFGINRSKVASLVSIAFKTTQAQISFFSFPTVLFSVNMINLVRKITIVGM